MNTPTSFSAGNALDFLLNVFLFFDHSTLYKDYQEEDNWTDEEYYNAWDQTEALVAALRPHAVSIAGWEDAQAWLEIHDGQLVYCWQLPGQMVHSFALDRIPPLWHNRQQWLKEERR